MTRGSATQVTGARQTPNSPTSRPNFSLLRLRTGNAGRSFGNKIHRGDGFRGRMVRRSGWNESSEPGGVRMYAKRSTPAGPVSDHHFTCGRNRFVFRGKKGARTEWVLFSAMHNIIRLWKADEMLQTLASGGSDRQVPERSGVFAYSEYVVIAGPRFRGEPIRVPQPQILSELIFGQALSVWYHPG